MHIQHVIADYQTRRISRSVWLIQKCLKADHSLFVIGPKGKVMIQKELGHMRRHTGRLYEPMWNPDCTILHSLSREHIKTINRETICLQQQATLSPAYGVRTVAMSRWCANKIGADDVLRPCGFSNPDRRMKAITIGLVTECAEDADAEEGMMIKAIARALPHVRFHLPYGTEAFRAMTGPDIGARAIYRYSTEDISGACHITLHTNRHDPTGDLVANAILSNSVPVVCAGGAQKEFVPDESLIYTTYHQAVRICCRLVNEAGRLDAAKEQCGAHYREHFNMPVFRRNLIRQLSKVVANTGTHAWT